MDVRDPRRGRLPRLLDLGRAARAAERDADRRHSLRDEMVEARHAVARRLGRHAAPRHRDHGRVRARVLRRRLYHEPAARRRDGRPGVDRIRVRRRAAPIRARRPRAPPRPASVLLEEREMGPRSRVARVRWARFLGDVRLPQLRRPVEGTAVQRRLNWQLGTVDQLVDETTQTKSIVLEVPEWAGHRAGQHVDVRLTAEDGYQAQRSYSIASAPEDGGVVLTVERLDDGEVSPYLTDELRPGDQLELRGPIGGYFIWEQALGGQIGRAHV